MLRFAIFVRSGGVESAPQGVGSRNILPSLQFGIHLRFGRQK